MKVGTVLLAANPFKEELTHRHLLRAGFVTEQTVLLVTGALEEPPTHRDLLPVVDKRTVARLLLGTLPELVEEHAVLLAPGVLLHDGVDAPVLAWVILCLVSECLDL